MEEIKEENQTEWQTKKIWLSDVIDYKTDIEPYFFTEIYCGTGGGKTEMVKKFITGEMTGTPMKVLLITSRRAKVDEEVADFQDKEDEKIEKTAELFSQYIGREGNVAIKPWRFEEREAHKEEKVEVRGGGHIYQRSAYVTNAVIEYYLLHKYDKKNPNTDLLEKFDMIIVDEVHSLVFDATYQSSPFYVDALIQRYIKLWLNARTKPKCKHMLLMTGTQDVIETFQIPNQAKHVVNKMDTFNGIKPKKVHFTDISGLPTVIKEIVNRGEKCLYIAGSIDRVNKTKKALEEEGISQEQIAVSFSDKEKRSNLDKDLKERMLAAEESIRKDNCLPDNISVFLTTTRYREGINIIDKSIQTLIVDSHAKADVLQMCGRLREGFRDLYVIINSPPHEIDLLQEKMEYDIAAVMLGDRTDRWALDGEMRPRHVSAINLVLLQEWCNEKKEKPVKEKFIELVNEKFRYLKYDPFLERFALYDLRMTGCQYYKSMEDLWEGGFHDKSIFQRLAAAWFQDSSIVIREYSATKTKKQREEEAWLNHKRWELEMFMNEYPIIIENDYESEKIKYIENEFMRIVDGKWKSVNVILKNLNFEYKWIQCGKGGKKRKFVKI